MLNLGFPKYLSMLTLSSHFSQNVEFLVMPSFIKAKNKTFECRYVHTITEDLPNYTSISVPEYTIHFFLENITKCKIVGNGLQYS